MSYLTFHLVFIVPPVLALAATLPRPLAGQGGARARWGIPIMCLVAFTYTIPWDNFLVYHGVWSYGPDRVLATVGYVPVEEYAFFVLQPILTGLFLYHLLARYGLRPSHASAAGGAGEGGTPLHSGARFIGVDFFLGLAVLGGVLLAVGWAPGRYAGLILAWACPVVAVLWGFGGNVAWHMRKLTGAAVLIPTVYLWCADAIALRLEIWHITEATSLGVGLLGLPVEEAAFFLLTNLLVVIGLLLFLYSKQAAGHALFQRVFAKKAAPRQRSQHST